MMAAAALAVSSAKVRPANPAATAWVERATTCDPNGPIGYEKVYYSNAPLYSDLITSREGYDMRVLAVGGFALLLMASPATGVRLG